MAMHIFQSHEIRMYRTGDRNRVLHDVTVTPFPYEGHTFVQLWARRRIVGDALVANHVNDLRGTIQQLLQDGEKDKRRNMSSVMMQMELEWLHPKRYAIPSTHQIHAVIPSITSSGSRARIVGDTSIVTSIAQPPIEKWRGIEDSYVKALHEIVLAAPDLMPKQ